MIPTLPLRPRNRLAHLILASLQDVSARAELSRLASDPHAADDWLEPGDRERYAPMLRERANRAAGAVAGRPPMTSDASLDEAIDTARVLFDAGLHFEVHELLEPYWVKSQGDLREALQGVIQIAVGHQHLANGNLNGARALLDEGAARVSRARITGYDVGRFVAAASETRSTLEHFDSGGAP